MIRRSSNTSGFATCIAIKTCLKRIETKRMVLLLKEIQHMYSYKDLFKKD